MTQKPFGVKQLNVIGAAGTPTIESAGDLNIGGQQVAITTNTSIAGVITATAFRVMVQTLQVFPLAILPTILVVAVVEVSH